MFENLQSQYWRVLVCVFLYESILGFLQILDHDESFSVVNLKKMIPKHVIDEELQILLTVSFNRSVLSDDLLQDMIDCEEPMNSNDLVNRILHWG